MTRTMARWAAFAAASLLAVGALAQPRRPRGRRPPASTDAGPPAAPSVPELIPVPVADIDTMLRQMRVWVFNPPQGSTAFGLSHVGNGHRLWALLPSCRQRHPDDPRDPCPVDRLVLEAVGAEGGVSVNNMAPIGVAPGTESRRVQSFSIPPGIPRLRLKVMGLNNHARYEAVVEVSRLGGFPAPVGSATPSGFSFDLTQYPSR